MAPVTFYRDEALPFLEAKQCTADELAYHKHFHEEYSIGLIEEGATNAWCDGTMLRVEAGRVISFPPLMLHACHPDQGTKWRYKMLFIRPDWLQGLERDERFAPNIPYLLGEKKNKTCRALIRRTMEALMRRGDPLEVESALIELMDALASRKDDDLAHGLAGRTQDHTYVKLVQDYIHAHFTERITLETLEKEAGISRFYLIRMFKQQAHLPPHAYQNLLRINYAKGELAKRRPIAEVAAEAGFYDQSHFTRMFARIVGATPRKYAVSL